MHKVKHNNRSIQAFSLKRSGHHAILNWLMSISNKPYCHYNNCRIVDDELYCYQVQRSSRIFRGTPVLSFEDKELKPLACSDIVKNFKKRILILRDPYNTFASRIRAKSNSEQSIWNKMWSNYLDKNLWKTYAKEFAGDTNYLGDCIKINYNSWFTSKEYRDEISKPFGKSSDKQLNYIPPYGDGSSFDGLSLQNNAQNMKVISRWESFIDDKEFKEHIINDDEIKTLSKRIFNFEIPDPRDKF